jgi:anti-sigma factor RsiW
MNREQFEELLPAYLEGDLDEATSAQVHVALTESAELRSSLNAYRALEDSLTMRREQVPPASQFLEWLPQWAAARKIARVHARSPLHGFFNTILSWPSLATLGFLVAGMWSFWHRDAIADFFAEGQMDTSGVESMGRSFSTLITTLTGGDMTVMIGIYGLITLGILAFTGAITARFVRSR